VRLLLLATLLGFGCTSLKAKQAALRDHPDLEKGVKHLVWSASLPHA
jgi:hypothetical protein